MSIEEFFSDIETLKHIERQGWKNRGVDTPRDTIASHSFGAALLGWLLGEKEDVDTDRIVKMLLVHDLIMAYIEDCTPEDEEFDSKKEREEKMAEKLFNDVPEEIEDEFRELFHEIRNIESKEARIGKEADKLDTLFQAKEYSVSEGEDFLPEFLKQYRDYFRTETGNSYFKEFEDFSRNFRQD